MVLILAIVLVKGNYHPHILLIFVPLLIVNLCWSIFKKAIGFRSVENIQMFDMVFNSLVLGISILWLLGHKLGNRNRFVTFLLALAIMAAVGLVGVISYGGTGISLQTMAIIILLAALMLTILLSFVLAAWCCRGRYGGVRFILWLGLFNVVVAVVNILVFYSIFFIISRPSIPIFTVLLQVSIAGLVLGGCLYAIIFSYMILTFRSSFFRQRFYSCLRLPGMTEDHTAEGAVEES